MHFPILVIQLRFGQLTYTFSENTNISMVDIEIGNYDQLQIENTVSVSILSLANATNATENDGMYMYNNAYIMP